MYVESLELYILFSIFLACLFVCGFIFCFRFRACPLNQGYTTAVSDHVCIGCSLPYRSLASDVYHSKTSGSRWRQTRSPSAITTCSLSWCTLGLCGWLCAIIVFYCIVRSPSSYSHSNPVSSTTKFRLIRVKRCLLWRHTYTHIIEAWHLVLRVPVCVLWTSHLITPTFAARRRCRRSGVTD